MFIFPDPQAAEQIVDLVINSVTIWGMKGKKGSNFRLLWEAPSYRKIMDQYLQRKRQAGGPG